MDFSGSRAEVEQLLKCFLVGTQCVTLEEIGLSIRGKFRSPAEVAYAPRRPKGSLGGHGPASADRWSRGESMTGKRRPGLGCISFISNGSCHPWSFTPLLVSMSPEAAHRMDDRAPLIACCCIVQRGFLAVLIEHPCGYTQRFSYSSPRPISINGLRPSNAVSFSKTQGKWASAGTKVTTVN